MADKPRSYWLSQTWSARKRPDGTLEPDAPIGGVGIGTSPDDLIQKGQIVRHLMKSLDKPHADQPFFIIQGRFTLFMPEP